jgi:hypothetical protein
MKSINSKVEDSVCLQCGESREINFDVCWNCGTAFSTTYSDYEEEEVLEVKKTSGIKKINDAGESLKKIGEMLLFFFLGMILFIIGTVISGWLNLILYCLFGLAEIILIIRIINSLIKAGSLLKNVTKEDFLNESE